MLIIFWKNSTLHKTYLILCTVDAVGLCPIIPYDEGLSALNKRLDLKLGTAIDKKFAPPYSILLMGE